MMVAMDGNFSQKRNRCAMSAPEPYKVSEVEKLWGKANEIKQFAKLEKEESSVS